MSCPVFEKFVDGWYTLVENPFHDWGWTTYIRIERGWATVWVAGNFGFESFMDQSDRVKIVAEARKRGGKGNDYPFDNGWSAGLFTNWDVTDLVPAQGQVDEWEGNLEFT